MFGLAWIEASRSRFVASRLEQSGRRRRRRGGRGKVAANAAKQHRYVEQEWCHGIATAEKPRRLMLINWSNHPILELTVSEDGESIPDASSGNDDASITVDGENQEPSRKKPRTPCERIHCQTLPEATQILRERLLSIPNLVLIGHSLERILLDWNVNISWKQQRCTATYPPYMEERTDPLSVLLLPGRLDDLMPRILKRRYSDDLLHRAAAAMDLYKKAQQYWEEDLHKLLQQKERSMALKLQAGRKSTIRGIPEHQKDHNWDTSYGDLPPMPSSITVKPPGTNDEISKVTDDDFSFPLRSRANTASSLDQLSFPSRTRALTASSMDQSSFAPASGNASGVWSSSLLHEASWSHENQSVISGETPSWLPQGQNEEPFETVGETDWLNEADTEGVLMGPPLPARLLNDSSSSSSSDEEVDDDDEENKEEVQPSPAKREESSHPVHEDDWLDEGRPQSKRFSWFGRRQNTNKGEVSLENEKTDVSSYENLPRQSSNLTVEDAPLKVDGEKKSALSPFAARWKNKGIPLS